MKCIVSILAVVHFMTCCGLAAYAADSQLRLGRYQSEIKDKESGVYEIDCDLYAHVRLKVRKADDTNRIKMRAALEANELLKNWAIGYTAEDRKRETALSDGWQLAVDVLDGINPRWRFSNWDIKLSGQELSGKNSEALWFGLIVGKDELIKQIPESFSRPVPAQKEIVQNLKIWLPKKMESDLKGFCAACGVLDFVTDANVAEDVRNEYADVDKWLVEYAERASLITHFALLAGGKEKIVPKVQTTLGKNAVSIYFDSVSPFDKKESTVQEALCENPGDAQLWNMHGRCLVKHDDWLGALLCFRMALKINSCDQYALTNLAMAYDALKCPRLARGMSILARGMCSDAWCAKMTEAILSK